jgi:HPt (histidine-containing phosphotransfer) domain-containing protein
MGMREMFIENGFNDFISKPIDVSKLDEVLYQWIPEEKKEQSSQERQKAPSPSSNESAENSDRALYSIPGIDAAKGIIMTGGTLPLYKQVLVMFCKDAQERMPLMEKTPEADDLLNFVTNVHALKSALASIGAKSVSENAAELEAAGKATDMAFIREHLPSFAQQLTEIIINIDKALGRKKPENTYSPSLRAEHSSLFKELASALKSQNAADIDRILEELNQKQLDTQTKEMLNKISDDVLITEFDSAVKTIEELLKG